MGATIGTVRFAWAKDAMSLWHRCVAGGLVLIAEAGGGWSVTATDGSTAVVLVSDFDQTKGKDINDAKRRAQAAAIVQLQLMGKY